MRKRKYFIFKEPYTLKRFSNSDRTIEDIELPENLHIPIEYEEENYPSCYLFRGYFGNVNPYLGRIVTECPKEEFVRFNDFAKKYESLMKRNQPDKTDYDKLSRKAKLVRTLLLIALPLSVILWIGLNIGLFYVIGTADFETSRETQDFAGGAGIAFILMNVLGFGLVGNIGDKRFHLNKDLKQWSEAKEIQQMKLLKQ